MLHGLNPERILIASEAVGLGQAALEKASQYARDRVVFDRTIGKNQDGTMVCTFRRNMLIPAKGHAVEDKVKFY